MGYDALTVEFTRSCEYLIIAGSNKQSSLYTRDGVLINSIGELSSWILCCQGNPSGTHVVRIQNYVFLASQITSLIIFDVTGDGIRGW